MQITARQVFRTYNFRSVQHFTLHHPYIVLVDSRDPLAVAKILQERQKALNNRSIREIARFAGLSASLVASWFRGDSDPRYARTANIKALAHGLDWTYEDLQKALGLTQSSQPSEEVTVLHIPIVDEGIEKPTWTDKDKYMPLVDTELKGRSERELFAIKVKRENMVSYANPSDIVIFAKADEAKEDQVIAVESPENDGYFINRFSFIAGRKLLVSNDNQAVKPRVFTTEEGSKVRGVALGVLKWEQVET